MSIDRAAGSNLNVPGNRGSSIESESGGCGGIRFEIGGGSVDSDGAVAGAGGGKRGRHLSNEEEKRRYNVRQHWIAAAPRGSLEIRSPAKEAAAANGGAGGRRLTNSIDDKKLDPRRAMPSTVHPAATTGDLTAEEKREGDEDVGSLPRTLSTSVLRIKHRRTFWEKVVG
jgi:hypothetical protein